MPERLHERIKMARNEMKVSQTEFGRRVGAKLRTVQEWEAGNRRPSKDAMEEIVKASGHPMPWFYETSEYPASSPVAIPIVSDADPPGMNCHSFMSALAKQQEILTSGQVMTSRLIGQNDRLIAMLEKEREDVSRLTIALTSEREWQRKREEKVCQPEHHSELVEKLLARIDALERRLQSVHGSAAFPGRAAER